MTSSQRHTLLGTIKDRLDAETHGVPRDSVERHYRNLEQLAASLRSLGLTEEQIDAGVMEVFEEYRQRISEYIAARQGEMPK